MPKTVTLAFEAVIEGGSVSLLDGESEIDCWIGSGKNSKAENILVNVRRLLNKNKIAKEEIDLIAVSSGPGSYTGVRNGVATALGLKTAFNCDLAGVSVLDAMTLNVEAEGKIITAVPTGRENVCFQLCELKADGSIRILQSPRLQNEKKFIGELEEFHANYSVLYPNLFETVRRTDSGKLSIIKSDSNLANLIGKLGHKKRFTSASDNVEIIYPNIIK